MRKPFREFPLQNNKMQQTIAGDMGSRCEQRWYRDIVALCMRMHAEGVFVIVLTTRFERSRYEQRISKNL